MASLVVSACGILARMLTLRAWRLPIGVCLALIPAAIGVARQEPQHDMSGPTPPARYVEPIRLFTVGLGPFKRPISTKNAEAQAFFTQGMQLMYAFAKVDAVRSFRMSWTRDPDCAICYWGEAWAWGSYLNGAMTATEAPQAWAALQKAIAMKSRAPEKERAFIDALSVRYVETFDAAKRVDQDRAYADAMKTLSEKYPDDLDAMTLYADALFLLEPRRGSRDADAPNVKRLLGVLEKVLDKDIHHPGACHLYIHATEATKVPGKAEKCADLLGDEIPGASHINHMPSHTYNQIGRWGDAVRANIQAWQSDQKAAIGEGFAIYPEHNLHMLLFSASFDGQGAIAIQAARDYAKQTRDTMYHALTLVRFGRFDEVAAVTPRPTSDVPGGMWDFAQAYAKLRLGKVDDAREDLGRLLKLADSSRASFRSHPARVLLGTVAGILEGEIHRQQGDLPGALTSLERAVRFEDEIIYDEPEPLPFSSRHWLGAAQIEARRFSDAEDTYRKEMAHHPLNGWSLVGLRQALAGQGKSTSDVDKKLATAWARSDTWLRASRF
jgi:tetratricopeptide (TPR) repeat protein